MMWVAETLRHPLTLLIVGSLISSILIPQLTRKWQNHEKELEIKGKLVEDINDSTTRFLMAIQFAKVRASSQAQKDYDEAYRNWEIENSKIESRIQTYFRASPLAEEWRTYADVVSDFYALGGTITIDWRRDRVTKIAELLEDSGLEVLVSVLSGPEHDAAWVSVKDGLIKKKNHITKQILTARSVLQ